MTQIEDRTDTVSLLKRNSICIPNKSSEYSSFALSPSIHSFKDLQQNGETKREDCKIVISMIKRYKTSFLWALLHSSKKLEPK